MEKPQKVKKKKKKKKEKKKKKKKKNNHQEQIRNAVRENTEMHSTSNQKVLLVLIKGDIRNRTKQNA